MNLSKPSLSEQLSLEETLDVLARSALVDGIAEFGSRTAQASTPASDYDLLLLVRQLPRPVFQMLTSIQGRLADIVLVETTTADALLHSGELPQAFFDQLFARKMQTARIIVDRSGRLGQVQQLVRSAAWGAMLAEARSNASLSGIWFWQCFGLLQLERMAQSTDPLHQTAVDMLLTACLAGTWRNYFDIRALDWNGEKAALRYWSEHDPGYHQLVLACLRASGGHERLLAYRSLVEQTIQPIGRPLQRGETAVALAQPIATETDVALVLDYWDELFRLQGTTSA
jgi:predicted nucleotidyltransferase